MKESILIRETYWETAKHFVNLIDKVAISGNNDVYTTCSEMSKINESAFFVLYWGQFENFINDKVLEIDSSALDMGFMSRLRLAISPKHEYYNDVDIYYKWRCDLAHGKFTKLQSLIIESVFDKFDAIVDEIDSTPLPIGDNFFF